MEKTIFNLSDAAMYTGYSKSHLYKLTHFKRITHFKPNGKNIFFKKQSLDDYLLQNRVEAVSADDVEAQAANYLLTSKSKAK
ncbi:helix-turn-helix domain-containing protein [Muriicola sp. Z0-33]|uniref:helix-turn-helix domain-containing protein n=1 Tax=Muriicola sp. Z0-33 TaxID=2816957 RepID=UPI002238DA44|nr:helix-turn-helix domain-containing protein [Muriicola sp. Z0-33]MCW5516157.1 helix-turn-helix domain-containing protein [Muriicola sp. Z0-33]